MLQINKKMKTCDRVKYVPTNSQVSKALYKVTLSLLHTQLNQAQTLLLLYSNLKGRSIMLSCPMGWALLLSPWDFNFSCLHPHPPYLEHSLYLLLKEKKNWERWCKPILPQEGGANSNDRKSLVVFTSFFVPWRKPHLSYQRDTSSCYFISSFFLGQYCV